MVRLSIAALAAAVVSFAAAADESPATAPKFLADGASVVEVDRNMEGVEAKRSGGGDLDIVFAPGLKGYPGVVVKPAEGYWDLSAFGHVECKITNTGKTTLGLGVRVDQFTGGVYKPNSWNTEQAWLKPGASQTVRVIFGYQYGHQSGYPLRSDKVARVLVFATSNLKDGASCRIEGLHAGGSAGEKPAAKPKAPSRKPKGGVMFDGARKPDQHGGVRPEGGKSWDMSDYWHVAVTLRNTGAAAVDAKVRLKSNNNAGTDWASATLKAGETKTVDVPFMPSACWTGPASANGGKGAGGTEFDSRNVSVLVVQGNGVEPVKAVGDKTPMSVPAWVGKRPPVEGDWVKTFDDEFKFLDRRKWNLKSPNYWDKRTHFSSNAVIVAGGKATMRYSKKTGWHNDTDGHPFGETAYETGFLSTYGKWTQRYGYIEARMKLPAAPGLWPAFWLMPDRGRAADPTGKTPWKRDSTDKLAGDTVGGMEFDIMEYLSAWGPNRFNVAFHWNGYGKNHKATGTSNAYLGPDKDGFITVGLLWEPGRAAVYGNGVKLAEISNERIADTQEYIMFDFVSGGWANNAIDDAALPADFVIDYVRCWQRRDLASPGDGAKPNDGRDLQPIAD